MGLGFTELAILASVVAICCFLPSRFILWHGGGKFFIGSLALVIMAVSVLAELAKRGRRKWNL